MKQWPEHSVQGYLNRLPSYKLEFLWNTRYNTDSTILTPADYERILSLLRTRPDSQLFDCDPNETAPP